MSRQSAVKVGVGMGGSPVRCPSSGSVEIQMPEVPGVGHCTAHQYPLDVRHGTPTTAPVVESTPSVADEVLKLADLLAKGLLTDGESSAAKTKLLSEGKEAPSHWDGVDRKF